MSDEKRERTKTREEKGRTLRHPRKINDTFLP